MWHCQENITFLWENRLFVLLFNVCKIWLLGVSKPPHTRFRYDNVGAPLCLLWTKHIDFIMRIMKVAFQQWILLLKYKPQKADWGTIPRIFVVRSVALPLWWTKECLFTISACALCCFVAGWVVVRYTLNFFVKKELTFVLYYFVLSHIILNIILCYIILYYIILYYIILYYIILHYIILYCVMCLSMGSHTNIYI